MKTKTIIILVFILHSTFNYAQKWHFEKVDSEREFKYEYWFSFQNEDDSNSIELIETPNQTDTKRINGIITDSKGKPIEFVDIIIKDNSGNIISIIYPNSKGEFLLERQFESFELIISTIEYDELISKINLKSNFNTSLKIKLGRAPELLTYQINAKSELNSDEITEIINCVKKNRDLNDENYLKNCSDDKKYKLCIQI
ncbi:hypothetical protein FLJC2902T_32070 [Flavobacterium limnosediminis JC2902]|uniref:Carboxypeptidase regulatory-like domain-containing protein n=1 Tax=Flavobacterium limnosediminis JC2902 TaxID=1341181 RepID=V6SC07_9FLAO|nr:hypothetical protein [Flavobacterium limnosediminis]ESU24009.1 hypothetical protein FLJC2902T_32070 [Flavobacterium limnosediminis JC2902]